MSEDMHDLTGPYIFPVRTWHKLAQSRRLGARPLYCVQRPGEIFYIPDNWWHATMNVDAFQMAYGGKPCCKTQVAHNSTKDTIMRLLPSQTWDAAGDTDKFASANASMPYAILGYIRRVERDCNTSSLRQALRRMRDRATTPGCEALVDTVA